MFEVSYGGEERFTVSLAKWLANHEHDVTLLGSSLFNIASRYYSKSILGKNAANQETPSANGGRKIKVLYPPYIIYSISRWLMCILWVVKILRINGKIPVSLIHSQDTGYAGLAALVAGRMLRIPVIITSHTIRHKTLESSLSKKLSKLITRFEYKLDIFTIRHATSYTVVNPAIRDYYDKLVDKNIEYTPISIRIKDLAFSEDDRYSIRQELGISLDTKVIGFVGRLAPEKNLFTLLDSFLGVVKNNPSATLILVGKGPLEEQLRDYASQLNIQNNVKFLGFRSDVRKILSAIDIFILPSFVEGLPTALLEAMASARAIICSSIPAHKTIAKHGENALLIDPNDKDGFAGSIITLSQDDLLRTRLGENAKLTASSFDEDSVFPLILKNYERIVGENNPTTDKVAT